MSEDKSGLSKVFKELTDPWDWAVAALGVAAGLGVTMITHFADAGTSAATGATLALSGRKALIASRSRSVLRKKAQGILQIIQNVAEGKSDTEQKRPGSLESDLKLEMQLWECDKTQNANELFAKKLEEFKDKLRNFPGGDGSLGRPIF